jgi:predicted ATPase
VVARAEGNPLFIEELAASLAERSTAGELPTSVRALIAARLDSLPPEERAVLVDASVVGRVFWRGALTEIAERDGLTELLGSLEARDLIRREAVSRIRGDQQYGFKHGLIHDVAYQRLPRGARRERHAAVARFLEATTDLSQAREALGHHWREAGEKEQAVENLVAAADQAGRGWAKETAVRLYREALVLVTEDEERRRDLTRRLAIAEVGLYHVADARLLRQARGEESP